MRHISETGLVFIRQWEGFRSKPYQDSGGVWTQGYGHTRGVTGEASEITQDEALHLLADDLEIAEAEVSRNIRVSLTDNQFAALVSLTFNAGSAPLLKTLGHKLNDGDYEGAGDSFLVWDHVSGVVNSGLENRRAAEKELFNS